MTVRHDVRHDSLTHLLVDRESCDSCQKFLLRRHIAARRTTRSVANHLGLHLYQKIFLIEH
jgi:hypothetical protein